MRDDIYKIYKHSYPNTLKNIHLPPNKLYVRGTMPSDPNHKYLCVIGSRNFSSYGRDVVNRFLSGIRGYPVSIVSGLAIGIDSLAHEAALNAGLHCIAFPGSALDWDSIYPRQHTDLAKRIVASGGALVSQWEVGYETGTWAFPYRNRLMAGLSHATLIIEASRGSGSLMTAKHAEQFDRDVLAVPGSIFSSNSYGPHMLIDRGAIQVTSPEDILDALGFDTSSNSLKLAEIMKSSDEPTKSIIGILQTGEATQDELFSKVKIPIQELTQLISKLELDGLIRVDWGTVKLV